MGRAGILSLAFILALVVGCTISMAPPSPSPIRSIPAVPVPTVGPDYTGEPCRFYKDMAFRRSYLKGAVINLRRYLINLNYEAPGERVWQAIDSVLPEIESLLLGVGVYSEWLLRITPPVEGEGLYQLELLAAGKMRSSLQGYLHARAETDLVALLNSKEQWISALTFYAATERDLVDFDERHHCTFL